MEKSLLVKTGKPAAAVLAALVMLTLSACGVRNDAAEMDQKLQRAEEAARKAVAAQQAAEEAAERVRLNMDVEGRVDDAERESEDAAGGPGPDSVAEARNDPLPGA